MESVLERRLRTERGCCMYEPGSGLLRGSTLGNLAVVKAYEPNRDLITAVCNRWGVARVSTFAYQNDVAGCRARRIDTLAVTNTFAYNSRHELQAAIMGTNSYGYSYDPIGNRITYTENAVTTRYKANELNQYTNIANGAVDEPTYDADGNMLGCRGMQLVRDGEYRLIAIANGGTVVTCAYDYMGRRYQKVLNGATNTFLYDGWAMIREQSCTTTSRYFHGLDLSGSLQGAGTIGGNLAADLAGVPVLYAYDANGNVTELVNTNGEIVANYVYGSYGGVIAESGTQGAANPFRFSTKYWDKETGLGYWGHRFYAPDLGMWLIRDPIGEADGAGLYVFVRNGPTFLTDSLGKLTSATFELALNQQVVLWGYADFNFNVGA